MNRHIILFILAILILLPSFSFAQNDKKQKMCYLIGQVKNSVTHELLTWQG